MEFGLDWVNFVKYMNILALHKKWSFPLRISSVNVTKSAGNCRNDRSKHFSNILRYNFSFHVKETLFFIQFHSQFNWLVNVLLRKFDTKFKKINMIKAQTKQQRKCQKSICKHKAGVYSSTNWPPFTLNLNLKFSFETRSFKPKYKKVMKTVWTAWREP